MWWHGIASKTIMHFHLDLHMLLDNDPHRPFLQPCDGLFCAVCACKGHLGL